jgi:putative two-component system response regulator
MLNAVRPNRIPIITDSSAVISAFDEFRPDLPFLDQLLDEWAHKRTQCAESTQIDILHRLACAAEGRDGDSGSHPHRVGELAALIGRSLNFPENRVELIRIAASLHDIGKIGIPDKILLKPEKLTAGEYKKIKTHTTIGSAMLSGSRFPSLQLAKKIALYHHERWDGDGYWDVKSEAIPVEARIVSIADTFDVLTHQRPYKQAWSVSDAIAEIKLQSGRQFDPHLVDLFTRVCLDGLQVPTDSAGEIGTPTAVRTKCLQVHRVVNSVRKLSTTRQVSRRVQ